MNTDTAAAAAATDTAELVTMGAGASTHYAYRTTAGKLTGTYCNRYARVRTLDTPGVASCSRCRKVAASEASVPAQEARA